MLNLSSPANLVEFLFCKIRQRLRSPFDVIYAEGQVDIRAFDNEDSVGKILVSKKNLIVTTGKQVFAKQIGIDAYDEAITKLRLSTGGHLFGDVTTPIPPQITDINLATPGTPPMYEMTPPTSIAYLPAGTGNQVRFSFTIAKADGNDAGDPTDPVDYTEAGLFTSGTYSGTPIMVARVTFASIQKTNARRLVIEWTLKFS